MNICVGAYLWQYFLMLVSAFGHVNIDNSRFFCKNIAKSFVVSIKCANFASGL